MTSSRKRHCRFRGKLGYSWDSGEDITRTGRSHRSGASTFCQLGTAGVCLPRRHHVILTPDKGCNMKCQEMAFLVGNRKCKHKEEPEKASWELRERPTRKKTGTDTQVSECPREGPLRIMLWALGTATNA